VAWNIGINLVPAGRGRGYGAEAQRLLAEHLLTTTSANRVEATTDVENTAEQRSLERAGFQRGGCSEARSSGRASGTTWRRATAGRISESLESTG